MSGDGSAQLFYRALADAVGPAQAAGLLHRTLEYMADVEALTEAWDNRLRGPRNGCLAAIEARFSVVDDGTRELLESFGPQALRLAARIVPSCSTKESLREALHMVGDAVDEAKLGGARQVLRALLERRFQVLLDDRWVLAIQVAAATDLDLCFERLSDAASIEDVLGHLIKRHRQPAQAQRSREASGDAGPKEGGLAADRDRLRRGDR